MPMATMSMETNCQSSCCSTRCSQPRTTACHAESANYNNAAPPPIRNGDQIRSLRPMVVGMDGVPLPPAAASTRSQSGIGPTEVPAPRRSSRRRWSSAERCEGVVKRGCRERRDRSGRERGVEVGGESWPIRLLSSRSFQRYLYFPPLPSFTRVSPDPGLFHSFQRR